MDSAEASLQALMRRSSSTMASFEFTPPLTTTWRTLLFWTRRWGWRRFTFLNDEGIALFLLTQRWIWLSVLLSGWKKLDRIPVWMMKMSWFLTGSPSWTVVSLLLNLSNTTLAVSTLIWINLGQCIDDLTCFLHFINTFPGFTPTFFAIRAVNSEKIFF